MELRQVIRNTALNLGGGIIPMLLSLITIPLVIRGFGIERFGIITIASALIGYFALFDFGLGRATTRFMAGASSNNDTRSAAGFFGSAFGLNALFGLVGAAFLAIIAPWLVGSVLNIPSLLKGEALKALFWLSLGIPLITTSSSLVGALESYHRFDLVNLVQIPFDLVMKIAPLVVLLFTQRADAVIAVLVFIRLATSCIYMYLCIRTIPGLPLYPRLQRDFLQPLVNYGGWLTVTNIVGPLMTYMDRFVIGSFLSMSAVTYYTTPYDLLRKLQVLPQSLGRTLFPVFGATSEKNPNSVQARFYRQSMKYLAILMVPIVVCTITFGENFLELWLSHEFAINSTKVLQILAVGAFVNALAKPPYALIQGVGKPDVTAKFHLLEFAFYLPMLFGLTQQFGIVGAAIAWVVRVFADTFLLRMYANKVLKGSKSPFHPSALFDPESSAFFLIVIAWFLSGVEATIWKLLATVFLIAAFLLWSWYRVLSHSERFRIRSKITRLFFA